MTYIILTVQPSRNKKLNLYRLGFDMDTSARYFEKPMTIILSLDDRDEFRVNIDCGIPPKQSYDLNDKRIDKWIKDNEYHCYPDRKPTKLIFSLTQNGRLNKLTHYKNENNCN